MNYFNSVVSRSHTPDLTESYFGKLASGHFPRLKSGQIRQIGNNIFQFTADNLLGSSNIGLDVGSQGQHEYTEACFFLLLPILERYLAQGYKYLREKRKKLPTFCHILFMVVPFDFICFECFSSDNILAEC